MQGTDTSAEMLPWVVSTTEYLWLLQAVSFRPPIRLCQQIVRDCAECSLRATKVRIDGEISHLRSDLAIRTSPLPRSGYLGTCRRPPHEVTYPPCVDRTIPSTIGPLDLAEDAI